MQRSLFFERAWMSRVFFISFDPQLESWGWFCLHFIKSAPAFRLVIAFFHLISIALL